MRGTLDVLAGNSGTKRCGRFRHRVPVTVWPEELLAVVVDKSFRVEVVVADELALQRVRHVQDEAVVGVLGLLLTGRGALIHRKSPLAASSGWGAII